MIFYNNQLAKNENQLWLYLVSNPSPFKRFEDHEAALQIWVHELVEIALEEGENVVMLIEEAFVTSYDDGNNAEELAAFIQQSEFMVHAMHTLKNNWDAIDETLPEDSIVHASETNKKQAHQIFPDITLRTYLEALANVYDN